MWAHGRCLQFAVWVLLAFMMSFLFVVFCVDGSLWVSLPGWGVRCRLQAMGRSLAVHCLMPEWWAVLCRRSTCSFPATCLSGPYCVPVCAVSRFKTCRISCLNGLSCWALMSGRCARWHCRGVGAWLLACGYGSFGVGFCSRSV